MDHANALKVCSSCSGFLVALDREETTVAVSVQIAGGRGHDLVARERGDQRRWVVVLDSAREPLFLDVASLSKMITRLSQLPQTLAALG